MFFFSDERCEFEKGKIQVQTEFPFYEPGNTINGKVYLEIMAPCPAAYLEIEVKGGEKCSHIRFWHETEGEGDDARTVEKHEKMKAKKKFLEYKEKVMQIPDGVLQPGVYEVGFQFLVPHKVPSSLHFADKKNRHEPKAKVKYYIKAKLLNHEGDDEMKYKQVLMIREPSVEFKAGD